MKKIFLLFLISFNSFAFNITSGISGSWYDHTNSGQGFNIEILNDNRVIIYWYSYDQGNPIWLVGNGVYEGNTVTMDMSRFQGSNFGINHNFGLVSPQDFGTATFTFNDCNSGSMTYDSSLGFGSGSLKLDRLTNISGSHCSNTFTEINGYVYEFNKAKLQGKQLIVTLTVTSNFLDRTTTFGNWTGQARMRLTDNKGNNYKPSLLQIGNDTKNKPGIFHYPLVADIPTTMILTFENIATNATSIGLLDIITSGDSRLDTNYQIRNIPFDK